MSQEIIPSRLSHLPAVPEDPFAHQATSAPQAPAVSPVKKLHRLLRGRYWLALTLGAIGAAAGLVAGWMLPKPYYQSAGLIEINPFITDIWKDASVMPLYNAFVTNQVARIQGPRVIESAQNSPTWKNSTRTRGVMAVSDNLEVKTIPQTSFVRVTVLATDPTLAQAAVRSVVGAYVELYGNSDEEESRRALSSLERKKSDLTQALNNRRAEIANAAQEYGAPETMGKYHDQLLEEQVKTQNLLRQKTIELAGIKSALAAREAAVNEAEAGDPNTEYEQIASVDPVVRGLLDQRAGIGLTIQRLMGSLGEAHRSVEAARRELKLLDQQLIERVEKFRKSGVILVPSSDGLGFIQVTASTIEALGERVKALQKDLTDQQSQANSIGRTRQQIQIASNDIERIQGELGAINRRLEELQYRNASSGRITVASDGDLPTAPYIDRRKALAGIGFLGGGLFPVAILCGILGMDRRYRYSDDAGSDMSGVPLLGILPNLPDLLTDPEQAAVAAHCVHQVRTMLQISADATDRRVYAVTSPSPGEGKTSLSLALALSFAASGSRTLLIDADIVGAGLTSRMNMTSPEGVMEAIASRQLLPFVRSSEIANLAILPVGSAQAHHSSMISPAAIRKLMQEARSHFDVVLIDTGPALASIEASPVCAAADAVVLCVSRGQHRPIVEKSLQRLVAIGARLAGVVFNKAQSQDFESSVSRMSMRTLSRSSGNGHGYRESARTENPNRLGPVAKAVSGDLPRTGRDG